MKSLTFKFSGTTLLDTSPNSTVSVLKPASFSHCLPHCLQALAEAAASDHGEPDGDDDDESTLVLPGGGPGDVANPADVSSSDHEEEGEQEEETDDEECDMPNIPADSHGNTSHGFNLQVLAVPPLPPTPPSSESEGETACESSETEYVTPPKRRAPLAPDESSLKKVKMDKAKKMVPPVVNEEKPKSTTDAESRAVDT